MSLSKRAFASLMLASLFALSQTALAAGNGTTGTITVNDSGATTANYETLHVISTWADFKLTSASEIYFKTGNFHIGGTQHFVNFTHASLSAVTNPNQNFSLASGTNNCVANLNAIASDHVEINSITASCTIHFTWTPGDLPSGTTVPQSVLYTYGSTQVIQQSAYFTDAPSFASAAAPAVFQNAANRTLIVKTPSSGLSTLDFYFPVYTTGGSPVVTTATTGGGGGQVGLGSICGSGYYWTGSSCAPNAAPSGNSSQTSSTTGSIVGIATVVAVITVVVALLIGRASEGPFRRPKSGSSHPRKPKSGKSDWGR